MKTLIAALVLFSTLNAQLSTVLAQGPLIPPGAPAPTMKSLDQLEPRTPISQPGSFPIQITQPGSYYLTGNITGVAFTDGIRINVSGVTIDLNGFTMTGTGSIGDGINVPATISNVTIRNGFIRSWGDQGLNLQDASNVRIENVTVNGSGDYGLSTGANFLIKDSIFSNNAGGGVRNLSGGGGIVITHSTASGNTGYGFALGSGATITNSSAVANTLIGISVNTGSAVNSCSAYDNGTVGISVLFGTSVTDCGVHSNGTDGITASLACVIKNNSVYGNTEDDIEVTTDCLVMNNTCTSAGFNTGDGAGIHVTGGRNRIDGNNVSSSDRGIEVSQPNNVIRNNSVTRNPTTGTPANYSIVAGNQVDILLTFIPETINIPATVTLAGDLTGVSGSNGLTITTDNVTVDLAGHSLVGIAGSLDGIVVSGSHKNIVVKNGTLRSWGGSGINAAFSTNGQFDRLELTDNGGNGLHAGDRTSVSDCTARNNTGNGIEAGIIALIARCVAAGNSGFGIKASETAVIEKCNLNNNPGGGITVSNYSVVRDNLCDFHTTNPGILVSGADNRIEGNNLIRNARGIDVAAAGNLIIKNSARGSTGAGTPSANYDFNGFTQTFGAIITATGAIAADPWANFSF